MSNVTKSGKKAKPSRGAKNSRSKRSVASSVMLATKERKRHQGGVTKVHDPMNPKSNVMIDRASCECKLDAYRRAGKIDNGEFEAGMQFRDAWLMKAEGVKTKDSTTFERVDGGLKKNDPKAPPGWAERILKEAFKEAGLTVGQSLIVTKVCGSDEAVGGEFSIKTLQRGLDKLARFWHFS